MTELFEDLSVSADSIYNHWHHTPPDLYSICDQRDLIRYHYPIHASLALRAYSTNG